MNSSIVGAHWKLLHAHSVHSVKCRGLIMQWDELESHRISTYLCTIVDNKLLLWMRHKQICLVYVHYLNITNIFPLVLYMYVRSAYVSVCVRRFAQSHLVIKLYVVMDIYANRVSVRTFSNGTSYNKIWYKLVTAIRSVNGRDVNSSSLNKSMLKEGDSYSRVLGKNLQWNH